MMSSSFKATQCILLASAVVCGLMLMSQYLADVPAFRMTNFFDSLKNGYHGRFIASGLFEWSRITPTRDLRWNDCFDGLECARLSVPINHHNPGGKQGAIALIRKVSPLGPDHPEYRGPILFNPGGPGASGIEFFKKAYNPLGKIVGPQFDLVSFDPRGVGLSIPHPIFFKSNFERLMWDLGALDDQRVAHYWAQTKVINAMVRENDDGGLRYINTDQTARDMLSIVHAYGRDKLQFWGFSYGSVLGSTFASMFPDKVERMVVDGIMDVEDYYVDALSNDLIDTDKAVDAFISSCHTAGPVGCHFWAPSESAIRNNITSLFRNIEHQPVSVFSPRQTGPRGVVDINLLTSMTYMSLYKPYTTFPFLAEAYAALAEGDGSVFFNNFNRWMNSAPLECPVDDVPSTLEMDLDGQVAIMCNDGAEFPRDLQSTQKYYETIKKMSPMWYRDQAAYKLKCAGWPKFPKTNFRGPLNGTTNYPILLVGNTADPNTPLKNAKKLSEGFPGSVVLTVDTPGHTSFSCPSVCTQSYIRQYFVEGTMPDRDTVCPTDIPIFGDQSVALLRAQNTFTAVAG